MHFEFSASSKSLISAFTFFIEWCSPAWLSAATVHQNISRTRQSLARNSIIKTRAAAYNFLYFHFILLFAFSFIFDFSLCRFRDWGLCVAFIYRLLMIATPAAAIFELHREGEMSHGRVLAGGAVTRHAGIYYQLLRIIYRAGRVSRYSTNFPIIIRRSRMVRQPKERLKDIWAFMRYWHYSPQVLFSNLFLYRLDYTHHAIIDFKAPQRLTPPALLA